MLALLVPDLVLVLAEGFPFGPFLRSFLLFQTLLHLLIYFFLQGIGVGGLAIWIRLLVILLPKHLQDAIQEL